MIMHILDKTNDSSIYKNTGTVCELQKDKNE